MGQRIENFRLKVGSKVGAVTSILRSDTVPGSDATIAPLMPIAQAAGLNRRALLRVGGLGALGIGLAACGVGNKAAAPLSASSTSPDGSPTPTGTSTPEARPSGTPTPDFNGATLPENLTSHQTLKKFKDEAEAQQWASTNLSGDEAWLQDPSHWHLTKDGGLFFDFSTTKEHVKLDLSAVKDQSVVQGYRNIWNGDSGNIVTRDAYVIVGEDSFYLREGTVWPFDKKLSPEESAYEGVVGYVGQVKLEASEQPEQKDVEVHADGFSLDGFMACEPLVGSQMNIVKVPEGAREKYLQALATMIGTDAWTRDPKNYSFTPDGFGGVVLKEDPTPGVHHRLDLSNPFITNKLVMQSYQDVRLSNSTWMRDAFVWVNDEKEVANTPNQNSVLPQVFVRRATLWFNETDLTSQQKQYAGQVAYTQLESLETADPTQKGVAGHLFGAPKPQAPIC